MKVGSLKTALIEYRPSLLIKIHVMGVYHVSMSVAELMANILSRKNNDDDNVTLFGSTDFIIKERQRGFLGRARAQGELPLHAGPLADEWLEIDVRQ